VIRFYLDEDLSPVIARSARSLGLDVVSSHDVGNNRLTDSEQLTFATSQGRCLVTANGRDFELLAAERYAAGAAHAGIAIVPGNWRRSDFRRIAMALQRLAEAHGDGPTENLQVYLR
jgi:predicted nuclease of predicted toxin-antitoxin system